MNIVLIAEELGVGGLPNYVLVLARLLLDAGFSVLVAHGNAPLPDHLEVSGLELLYLRGLAADADPTDADAALAKLEELLPDVVHVHLCSNMAVIERLLRSQLPLVRSFHDYTSLCLRRGRRRWRGDRCQRALGWGCAAWGCVVVSPQVGTWWPQYGDLPTKIAERDGYRDFGASVVSSAHMAVTLERNGFAADRIHMVPHFSRFEADAVSAELPGKLAGVPGRDRPLELLFSGQAVTGKGLEILIAALAGLAGDWRLSVLGDGPRLIHARKLAARLGLNERIRFLGWVPQSATREHYRLADLLVIPSIWDDPIPLVGLEAMSFGTPLVGFAVGGIPDYLIDGETGVLVRQVDTEGLRAGLAHACRDPDSIARWGLAARTMVARGNTRAAHLSAILGVYEAVISERGRDGQGRVPAGNATRLPPPGLAEDALPP